MNINWCPVLACCMLSLCMYAVHVFVKHLCVPFISTTVKGSQGGVAAIWEFGPTVWGDDIMHNSDSNRCSTVIM